MTLTLRGAALTVAGLTLLTAGFLFGYAELTVLGAAALVAVAYAFAHAALRPTLEVARQADPDRVHRGEASTVTLSIRNTSRFGAATLIAHDSCGPEAPVAPQLKRLPWQRNPAQNGQEQRFPSERDPEQRFPSQHDPEQRFRWLRLPWRRGPAQNLPSQRGQEQHLPTQRDPDQRRLWPRLPWRRGPAQHGPAQRHASATVPVPLLRLRRGRVSEVSYDVPTQRRGLVHIGPLQVIRRDPLGIVTASRKHGGTSKIWVYPRVHLIQAVPAGITRSLDGRVDRVPHGTITFDALREYVIGDELRHVHWRTSARVGQLMVREHVDTSLPRLVLLLDDRMTSWPDAEPFEVACEAAASIILAAVRESLPITLHLVSGSAATANPRSLLDLLAEAQLTDGDLGTAATSLRRHRPGDTLIYLTGTESYADLSLVTGLRGAFPVVAAGMLGPRTKREPKVAGVLSLRAEDGEEFAALWDGVGRW